MKRIIIRFGLLAAALMVVFQVGKFSLFLSGWSDELRLSIFGLAFLILGGAAVRMIFLTNVKNDARIENPPSLEPDQEKIRQLGISSRELEVLRLIAKGLSNQEIAEALFISETTVKTHVSNLLVKLDARRRTEAVKIAKDLKLL